MFSFCLPSPRSDTKNKVLIKGLIQLDFLVAENNMNAPQTFKNSNEKERLHPLSNLPQCCFEFSNSLENYHFTPLLYFCCKSTVFFPSSCLFLLSNNLNKQAHFKQSCLTLNSIKRNAQAHDTATIYSPTIIFINVGCLKKEIGVVYNDPVVGKTSRMRRTLIY